MTTALMHWPQLAAIRLLAAKTCMCILLHVHLTNVCSVRSCQVSDGCARCLPAQSFPAGHETTAATLGFLLYYLAQHPHWEEAIRDEARVRPQLHLRTDNSSRGVGCFLCLAMDAVPSAGPACLTCRGWCSHCKQSLVHNLQVAHGQLHHLPPSFWLLCIYTPCLPQQKQAVLGGRAELGMSNLLRLLQS
jgi:hypothetical protein